MITIKVFNNMLDNCLGVLSNYDHIIQEVTDYSVSALTQGYTIMVMCTLEKLTF